MDSSESSDMLYNWWQSVFPYVWCPRSYLSGLTAVEVFLLQSLRSEAYLSIAMSSCSHDDPCYCSVVSLFCRSELRLFSRVVPINSSQEVPTFSTNYRKFPNSQQLLFASLPTALPCRGGVSWLLIPGGLVAVVKCLMLIRRSARPAGGGVSADSRPQGEGLVEIVIR